MLRFLAVIGYVFFLVGCDNENGGSEVKSYNERIKESAENYISSVLKDPESARFGEFTVEAVEGFSIACFTVNAKNSYGGYVGDKVFALVKLNDEPWDIISSKGDVHGECVVMNKKITDNVVSMTEAGKASPQKIKELLLRHERLHR